MLTVQQLNGLDTEGKILKWLDTIYDSNKSFYYFLIDHMGVIKFISSLQSGNKVYLPSGLCIQVDNDKFKLTNIFDNQYVKYVDTIFNP